MFCHEKCAKIPALHFSLCKFGKNFKRFAIFRVWQTCIFHFSRPREISRARKTHRNSQVQISLLLPASVSKGLKRSMAGTSSPLHGPGSIDVMKWQAYTNFRKILISGFSVKFSLSYKLLFCRSKWVAVSLKNLADSIFSSL